MTPAEKAALAEQQEAKRQGAVAFHHKKPLDACPFKEGDPLRQYWLEGRDAASKGKNRLDMDPIRAEGFRAFQDGLRSNECPYGRGKRGQWIDGWEQAKHAKERDDEIYR
jgi:ribosome modulation factor